MKLRSRIPRLRVPRGMIPPHSATSLAVLFVLCATLSGCSKDVVPTNPSATERGVSGTATIAGLGRGAAVPASPSASEQDGQIVPADLRTIDLGGESITFWPYTGTALDGVPSDPITFVFVGRASAREIRDALLALDGDRSALGLPAVPPFNARWSDAIGDAQTTYIAGTGWVGSVVQLALGDYRPVRFHLRLFETGARGASGEAITLGSVHFEVLIPGTADHQVLSWELAEQVVAGDLARGGLLDPAAPLTPTPPLNAAPGFREIPPPIYNGLPDDLIFLIGGPAKPQSEPVPIANDGLGLVVRLKDAAPAAPAAPPLTLDLEYGQIVPRPFCSSGPGDFVFVEGPVHLQKEVTVEETGRLRIRSRISGRLIATPVDPSTNPPQPIGEPFSAEVQDIQSGWTTGETASILASSRRIAPQDGGTELLLTRLHVTTGGPANYRAQSKCTE